jgi:hypothetical protein
LKSLDELRELQRTRQEVYVVATETLYGCCNRPPSRRFGYEQVYRGVIADVDDRRLILHSIALAALNYHVIAELRYVSDVLLVG